MRGLVIATAILKDLFEAIKRTEEPLLTRRETQVIALISRGYTQPQVATELSIAICTVKSHCRHVLIKLEAPNQAGAVGAALRRGLID